MKYSPIIDYFRLIKAFMNVHDPLGLTRHSFKTNTCTMPEKLPLITINKHVSPLRGVEEPGRIFCIGVQFGERKNQLTLKRCKEKRIIHISWPHKLVPHPSFSSFSHELISLFLGHAVHIDRYIFNPSFRSGLRAMVAINEK